MSRRYHWQGDRRFSTRWLQTDLDGCRNRRTTRAGVPSGAPVLPVRNTLDEISSARHMFPAMILRHGVLERTTVTRQRGYARAMLAVRRRPEDCPCPPLLGTAGGATWWQVSEAKWVCSRGTGPGFRGERAATAGPPCDVSTWTRLARGLTARGLTLGAGLRAATASTRDARACVPRGGIRKRESRSRSRGSTAV